MPRFRKAIVKAGVYHVATPKGERRTEVITDDRIKHWAQTYTQMSSNDIGFKMPAPWAHSFKLPDGQVFIPGPVNGGDASRSDFNAGFWENLSAEVDPEDGIMTLYGEVDAPGDPNDLNTPAGKIGKTVRETSILAAPEFIDGKGNKFNDALMHVALVTHPIEPGQKNFTPVPEQTYALAMSHFAFKLGPAMQMAVPEPPEDDDNDSPDSTPGESLEDNDEIVDASDKDVGSLLPMLRKCNINLPDDTNELNLIERLKIALGQKSFAGEDDDEDEGFGENNKKSKGTLTKPPKGAEVDPAATVMSQQTQIDNATLMSHPVVQGLKAANDGLLKHITNTEKSNRRQRINRLIQTGRATQDYATKSLLPLVESFQMSFGNDGAPVVQPIDTILEALEAAPVVEANGKVQGQAFANPELANMASFMMSATAPEGADVPPNSHQGFDPATIDETQAEKLATAFFN